MGLNSIYNLNQYANSYLRKNKMKERGKEGREIKISFAT